MDLYNPYQTYMRTVDQLACSGGKLKIFGDIFIHVVQSGSFQG